MKTTTFLGNEPINRMGCDAMQPASGGLFGPPRDAERLEPYCAER